MARKHWLDVIADEAFQIMKDDEDYIVKALRAGTLPPGAANLTEKQKLDVYKRYLLNPDGTWNEQHQAALFSHLTPEDYVAVINALDKEDAHGQIGLRPPPEGLLNYGEE